MCCHEGLIFVPKAARKAVPNFGSRFKLRAIINVPDTHVARMSDLAMNEKTGNARLSLSQGSIPGCSGSCGEEKSRCYLTYLTNHLHEIDWLTLLILIYFSNQHLVTTAARQLAYQRTYILYSTSDRLPALTKTEYELLGKLKLTVPRFLNFQFFFGATFRGLSLNADYRFCLGPTIYIYVHRR